MLSSVARVRRSHWMLAGIGLVACAGVFALPMTAQSGKAFIVQTNSAGDSVSIIDPTTEIGRAHV